jgi:membrane protein YqaA with SNARE-associated domain
VTEDPTTPDRCLWGWSIQVIAFAWGFAEATVFFIVPDVLLTFIACRALQPAMKATGAALAGALLGGAVVYGFVAREMILHVPGIHDDLVISVQAELRAHGLAALLIGPLRGIPYKIYAMEWAARSGSLAPLLLVSIPARWLRFALSVLIARVMANVLARWTGRRARLEFGLVALFWGTFYTFYFAHFGW